jgi:hypothetical protein
MASGTRAADLVPIMFDSAIGDQSIAIVARMTGMRYVPLPSRKH